MAEEAKAKGNAAFLSGIFAEASQHFSNAKSKIMAEQAKAKGNAAFLSGNFTEAIEHFSNAIHLAPTNHVLYSNRSASYASLNKYSQALTDAKKTVELKPDWTKGYSRVGAAYVGLGSLYEAITSYKKGLEIDPNNEALKSGRADAQARSRAAELWGKLVSDSTTRDYLHQLDFIKMIQDVLRNPNNLNLYMKDPRMMRVLGLFPNVTMKNDSPEEEMEMEIEMEIEMDKEIPNVVPEQPKKKQPEPEPELMEVPDEEKQAKERKVQAQKEKELGNAAYMKKEFEKAIEHYSKAIELDDGDISCITNRAAVYLEMGKVVYVKIIKTIKLALDGLETVEDIKSMLCDSEGLSEAQQELLFAGNHLKDDSELADYGIKSGSTLYMFPYSDQRVIYIKLPWIKDNIKLYVNDWNTINDVKAIIENEGYPANGISLIYKGEHLKDCNPLAFYDIHSYSILNAVDDPKELAVIFISMPTGKALEIEVKLWYTVSKVKSMIESRPGVPADKQRLYFAMKQLDDVQMLADYNIQNMSILHLVLLPSGMIIHVRILNGKTIMLEVKTYDTVKNVKMKIQDKEGIPIDQMSLLFAGRKLQDNHALVDYSVKDESILILVRRNDGHS